MPVVNIPGVGRVNFPDDMPQEDIQREAARLYNEKNLPPYAPGANGRPTLAAMMQSRPHVDNLTDSPDSWWSRKLDQAVRGMTHPSPGTALVMDLLPFGLGAIGNPAARQAMLPETLSDAASGIANRVRGLFAAGKAAVPEKFQNIAEAYREGSRPPSKIGQSAAEVSQGARAQASPDGNPLPQPTSDVGDRALAAARQARAAQKAPGGTNGSGVAPTTSGAANASPTPANTGSAASSDTFQRAMNGGRYAPGNTPQPLPGVAGAKPGAKAPFSADVGKIVRDLDALLVKDSSTGNLRSTTPIQDLANQLAVERGAPAGTKVSNLGRFPREAPTGKGIAASIRQRANQMVDMVDRYRKTGALPNNPEMRPLVKALSDRLAQEGGRITAEGLIGVGAAGGLAYAGKKVYDAVSSKAADVNKRLNSYQRYSDMLKDQP